jgi:hypothetical protein
LHFIKLFRRKKKKNLTIPINEENAKKNVEVMSTEARKEKEKEKEKELINQNISRRHTMQKIQELKLVGIEEEDKDEVGDGHIEGDENGEPNNKRRFTNIKELLEFDFFHMKIKDKKKKERKFITKSLDDSKREKVINILLYIHLFY